ncbi:hypothetical protein [Falsiroseomonas sp. E2-1-a4]|uniref:hypothetical protein n=1 Tax=Falsiroseomonas sp. E2-1-a4 TaxID=3239299 RepID=UPI003F59B505
MRHFLSFSVISIKNSWPSACGACRLATFVAKKNLPKKIAMGTFILARGGQRRCSKEQRLRISLLRPSAHAGHLNLGCKG